MTFRAVIIRRVLLPVALVAAGAALPAATAGAGKVSTVEIATSFYSPATMTVKQGDKVRFKWTPSFEMHDVSVKSGPQKFRSPLQAAGTYTKKFTKAGKYVLYCSQHSDMGMTLKVKRRSRR